MDNEFRKVVVESIKLGRSMSARGEGEGIIDCVDGYRYCRECGEWIWKSNVSSHLENTHNLTFKEYCYKYNTSLEKEDPKICPYCESGELIGLFTSKNGGSIITNCGKSKTCTSNKRAEMLSNQFDNEKFLKNHKERSSLIMNEVNKREGFRENLSKIHSERLKELWKNEEWRAFMIESVKAPFKIPLNFLRTGRIMMRSIPYGREYTSGLVYLVKINEKTFKIGMLFNIESERLETFSNLTKEGKIILYKVFSNPISAYDVETALLAKSWRYHKECSDFGSENGHSEIRDISCLEIVINELNRILPSYFELNNDFYSELEPGRLFKYIYDFMDNEWKNLNENPYEKIN